MRVFVTQKKNNWVKLGKWGSATCDPLYRCRRNTRLHIRRHSRSSESASRHFSVSAFIAWHCSLTHRLYVLVSYTPVDLVITLLFRQIFWWWWWWWWWCTSVYFYSIFWTDWPLNLSCVCMSHDPSLSGTERQGHRLKVIAKYIGVDLRGPQEPSISLKVTYLWVPPSKYNQTISLSGNAGH